MKFFKIITIFSVFAFPVSIAHANNDEPYRYELNTEFLAKTNRQIEKELPVLERQVELLIKMISNDRYRAKIQNELSEVLIGYMPNYKNYDPEKIQPNENLGTAKNESEWKRGQKLSFLAKVLKEYKAPLSKTCIGINYRGEKNAVNQDIYQPLNWHFPIAYLSGQMFTKKRINQLGFGAVDLLSLSEPELISIANLSNKIIDLQIVLRDGFEDKLNLDVLQQYVSLAHAKNNYKYKYNAPFGIVVNSFRYYKNKPCDIFRGNGDLAAKFWPVIGYEMILPTEIIPEYRHFNLSKNDYSTGGGILESDLEKFPPEYIDAWKNLAYFYNDYYPDLKVNFPIEMYDKILTAKAEEPLGDLMSGENDGSNSTIEDDELALPSLE